MCKLEQVNCDAAAFALVQELHVWRGGQEGEAAMSVSYRMTISEELAQLVEQRRGVLSLQACTLLALLDACEGSRIEHELR